YLRTCLSREANPGYCGESEVLLILVDLSSIVARKEHPQTATAQVRYCGKKIHHPRYFVVYGADPSLLALRDMVVLVSVLSTKPMQGGDLDSATSEPRSIVSGPPWLFGGALTVHIR
ncbi:unnamed protein product, partial [Ectocarpus sp. 13 AM-2016]